MNRFSDIVSENVPSCDNITHAQLLLDGVLPNMRIYKLDENYDIFTPNFTIVTETLSNVNFIVQLVLDAKTHFNLIAEKSISVNANVVQIHKVCFINRPLPLYLMRRSTQRMKVLVKFVSEFDALQVSMSIRAMYGLYNNDFWRSVQIFRIPVFVEGQQYPVTNDIARSITRVASKKSLEYLTKAHATYFNNILLVRYFGDSVIVTMLL